MRERKQKSVWLVWDNPEIQKICSYPSSQLPFTCVWIKLAKGKLRNILSSRRHLPSCGVMFVFSCLCFRQNSGLRVWSCAPSFAACLASEASVSSSAELSWPGLSLRLRSNYVKQCVCDICLLFPSVLFYCNRFTKLKSLNLSNNHLGDFPLAVCSIPTLTELNVSCNSLRAVPAAVGVMHKCVLETPCGVSLWTPMGVTVGP